MTYRGLIWARRVSQLGFLALFLALLTKSESWFLRVDPLAALANALASGALYRGLLWSLAVLIPTFFLGRVFCGWVCPLGTLHHFAGSVKSGWKRGARLLAANRYRPWQAVKYWLLAALAVSTLLGSAWLMALDPIALLVRTLRPPHFAGAFVFGLLFFGLLAANLLVTRFWCRALCPLGALLGVASRWSVLGLEKDDGSCGDCNRCLLHCQGGDDPIPGAKWRKAECHVCLNCVADCPESGIRFRFFPSAAATVAAPGLGRRQLLAGAATGLGLAPLLRAGIPAHPLRPPGALEESRFLARCIRCGACMEACPTHALQPSWSEAGIEGLWTPVVVPRIGYCEPSCVLCSSVCPTGAIWKLGTVDKGWGVEHAPQAGPVRIGTAFYDRGRCLPWAMATECIVCQEWCPTSPKAIYLRPAEAAGPDGEARTVRQPYVNPSLCVGCGACEFACPVRNAPAVYVTSVGETRSTNNQMLLKPPESLLPDRSASVWTRSGPVRTFEPGELWRYIDGDAERYLRAGLRRAFTAGYRSANGVDAVADVYEMANPDGARRIFDAESAAGSKPLAVGDSGRNYGQAITFRRGRYFVRLTAYQEQAGLEELAHALDRKRFGQ